MEEFTYHFNLLSSFVAALVPFVLGWIWYHPKTFGTVWMKSVGKSVEYLKGGNVAVNFGLAFVFTFVFAYGLDAAIEFIHYHPELAAPTHSDHIFRHGAFHGLMLSLVFIVAPALVVNALFKRLNWTSLSINIVYCVASIALMGGIVDAWN